MNRRAVSLAAGVVCAALAAKRDQATYDSNTLTIRWHASDPGDHIRVTTAITEPQTYALLLAGLGAMALVARRRRIQPSPTPA